jgi:hypothetical protein
MGMGEGVGNMVRNVFPFLWLCPGHKSLCHKHNYLIIIIIVIKKRCTFNH